MTTLNKGEVHEIKRLIKAWEDSDYSTTLSKRLTMRLQEALKEYFVLEELWTQY